MTRQHKSPPFDGLLPLRLYDGARHRAVSRLAREYRAQRHATRAEAARAARAQADKAEEMGLHDVAQAFRVEALRLDTDIEQVGHVIGRLVGE